MAYVTELKDSVLAGRKASKEEVMRLIPEPLDELTEAANEIREHFCGSRFDLCTIINGKNGMCSEDCKYCAQSVHYQTNAGDAYPLLSTAQIYEQAKYNEERGVLRYSIVTSGKRLSSAEVDRVCESIRYIRSHCRIEVCVSFGLLDEEQFQKIRDAGASRVHCNLESSAGYFKEICSTHTYEEKIETLKAAKRAGLSICSGGIIGLGETMEDRIDMVLTVRKLGVTSVPVNVLNPIPGTPLEHNPVLSEDEVRRTVALFRFLIPEGDIRLAGGRGLFEDKGLSIFRSGANAAISGDMLTTQGITVETDRKLLGSLGYEVRLS
ncbi:MAG: biotin synthase BioB [Clostridiales bacterium]|nr:biotin synthase BioB [Clostridiales bacterium]